MFIVKRQMIKSFFCSAKLSSNQPYTTYIDACIPFLHFAGILYYVDDVVNLENFSTLCTCMGLNHKGNRL